MINRERPRKRVALLVETSTSWGSDVIRGAAEFAQAHGPWQFFIEPRGKRERLLLPEAWEGDGVIARVTHEALAAQLIDLKIPAVNVSWYEYGLGAIPQCSADAVKAAHISADYFLDRGYRHFAYCPSNRRPNFVDRYGHAFVEYLKERGFTVHVFQGSQLEERNWQQEMNALRRWVAMLPKPIGMLTFEDVRGRQLTEACQLEGVPVPDEVAVLGGEYDQLSAEISSPKLSSLDHSGIRVGYRAAEILAEMMSTGGRPVRKQTWLPPAGVITRQSTDTLAIEDSYVAAAVKYIGDHACEPIQVTDVLKHIGSISRRTLEQRFIDWLGRSPAAEIRRARVLNAQRLLIHSNDPMPQIASRCGFSNAEVLTRIFRREMGVTPAAFRRQFK